jgi:hypothetical protein
LQIPGLNYTYAPVPKHYIFSSVDHGHRCFKGFRNGPNGRVTTVFLYGTLKEEIYMQRPEGFIISGREGEVCRLIKSLYGLKQAFRVWNKFNEFLIFFTNEKHG